MAKVTGPLFCERASGMVNDFLLFEDSGRGAVIRKKNIPPVHKTAAAIEVKQKFSDISKDWEQLPPDERRRFEDDAIAFGPGVSGKCMYFEWRLSGGGGE